METYNSYLSTCKEKGFGVNRRIDSQIQKYLEIFGETPVFNSVRPGEKAGFKNWDNSDKLKSANEIGFLLSRHRNIGIRLGIETERGYTVCFDKESYGDIPDNLLQSISKLAVASWDSQSGGDNNLLTVTQDAYEHLDQFKQKVTFEGEKHDLELLTSGYALVPPSKIDDNHQYDELETNPEAPTVGIDSVKQLLTHIPVSEKSESDSTNQSENAPTAVEIDTIPDSFDHREYFENNIPGNDSYLERLDTMLQNEEVAELWYGNYEDRSKGELQLRSYVAWYFHADTKMVQYIFENELPNWREEPLKYELNKHHAKDVITDIEDYINRPYYTTGISFTLWNQLAKQIHENETVTVNELQGRLVKAESDSVDSYKERTIQHALQTLVQKDIINRKSNCVYENKRIDKEYLDTLNELIDNYEPTKLVYNNV